jgi:hypothetical protein
MLSKKISRLRLIKRYFQSGTGTDGWKPPELIFNSPPHEFLTLKTLLPAVRGRLVFFAACHIAEGVR